MDENVSAMQVMGLLGSAAIAILSGVAAGIWWFVRRQVDRLDRAEREVAHDGKEVARDMHEQNLRLTRMEAGALTKDDLRSMEARMMGALGHQHSSMTERIGRLETDVDQLTHRVDHFIDSQIGKGGQV